MYKSKLKKKIDPSDWFSGPGSHIRVKVFTEGISDIFSITQ